MKKKNLLLASTIGVSAIALAACTGTTAATPQEKFIEGFVDLYEAESLQTNVAINTSIDVDTLVKQGLSKANAEKVKETLEGMNLKMKISSTEKYAEAIISMNMEDKELGVDFKVEMPIVVDLEKEKVYMGTDWLVDMFGTIAGKMLEENKDDNAKEAKKEIDKLITESKTGKFIDLSNINEESLFADMGAEDLLANGGLGLEKSTVEEIKAITDFLSSLKVDNFVENKDGSVTFKLSDEQIDKFLKLTELITIASTEEIADLSDEELIESGKISDVKDLKITTSYSKNKLSELKIDYTAEVGKGYTYSQEVIYEDIKMNTDVKTTYALDTIKILTPDEETELTENVTGLLFVVMFGGLSSEGE